MPAPEKAIVPSCMPLAATDDLGRVCPIKAQPKDRQVGLFYFLWTGKHGSDHVYNNMEILARDPDAPRSRERWARAGGCSDIGAMHWWGEPLFHYYTAQDAWVVRKHIRMFIDMGIDFLMIDATNATYYPEASLVLFSVLEEFHRDGWIVPRVGYYTCTQTGKTIQDLYEGIYLAHPEYRHLWYYREGKPFVVGELKDSTLTDQMREFFTIDDAYMSPEPYRTYSRPDTFTFDLSTNPKLFSWMDFSDVPCLIRNEAGEPKMMTISVGAISETQNFVYPYFWDTNDRTRSWDGKQNRNRLPGEEDAWKYGINFAREIEHALEADPPLVFITGWNEWIAGNWKSTWAFAPGNPLSKYTSDPEDMCIFVDQFNLNNSRDSEPMEGGYGDSYMLQMAAFIRRYKGVGDMAEPGKKRTIDMNGCFCQWKDVSAVYRHPVCDNASRDLALYENWQGDTPEARKYLPADQIIRQAKVCRDDNNYYFYVQTIDPIAHLDEDARMTLFLNIHPSASGWYGYDFVIRRKAAPGDTAVIEKCTGGYAWEEIGTVRQTVSGNEMMLSVPAGLLGLDEARPEYLEFKWADHWQETGDIWTFYKDGEAAPYGRFNYIFPNR